MHTGLAVITGTEDRQHAYVALTRGTDINTAYVFTTSPKHADPAPSPRPAGRPRSWPRYDHIHAERTGLPAPATPLAPPGTALGVLSAVLDRDGQQHSATQAQREELTPTTGEEPGEIGQWIMDPAAGHRTFADKLADRQSLTIPSANPDYGDLGQAFPSWPGPATDAILQPPKPEIAPSPQILQRLTDRDADWEAAD